MLRNQASEIKKIGNPSQEEQDTVARYVLKRPMNRPNTSYTKAFLYITVFVAVNVLMTFLLCRLIIWFGLPSFYPKLAAIIRADNTIAFYLSVGLLQFLISGILVIKPAVIGAIHLYQRYAPEEVRRRCLFKPTCSEYAILAVKKYGVVRGLLMTYDRVFHRCRGRTYRIDEP